MMIKRYSELVKLSHTIFALPFAMIGFTYGLTSTDATFSWIILAKVLLCMLFARNTAMGFNRWADRKIDGENPRTANREIPSGVISPRSAVIFITVNALLFISAAASINNLTAILSPVALIIIMGYSYCKRFTSTAHLILGLSLSIAPMGAYIAVTGLLDSTTALLSAVVLTWCAGFDIIYALQDRDFDRAHGLHSIPSQCSIARALGISIALHIATVIALLVFFSVLNAAWWIWIGFAIFVALLIAQHIIVTPNSQRNIGIAFGTLNGIASLILAIFTITALLFPHK